MNDRRTSFYGMTSSDPQNPPAIDRVEIPIFQRDYAQGRQSDVVSRIRDDFLHVLRGAFDQDAQPVGLDFVYGGVEDGTLRPLDGQQRLTTLFLLHWYIASLSGHLEERHRWTCFSYATRQSASMFCESLTRHGLPRETSPAEWIKDQPWYQFLWRHDPTIQSMLVVLDAIHELFEDVDAEHVWQRLTDPDDPAIWFLLLPLSDLGSGMDGAMSAEDLYIKMNSRGKPLTEFENFKARFEKTIAWSDRAEEFARKVDTEWTDIFWNIRGDDDLIDDEFLRYFEFVTELCEWRDGRHDGSGQRLEHRALDVFGPSNERREEHVEFLFTALDIWRERDIPDTFERWFTSGEAGSDGSRVRLFFRSDKTSVEPLNLFTECCRSYGVASGRTRSFSLGQTVVLYAVVLHLMEDTPEFGRRIRVLRNLVEASADDLRPDRMPAIIGDVERLVRSGVVGEASSFNRAQVEDELVKKDFIGQNPTMASALFVLEDHRLLRGAVACFELDPATFMTHATVFRELMEHSGNWSSFLAALLAVGPYQRPRTRSGQFLFGTDSAKHEGAWRELLTGPKRSDLQPTRQVLGRFLDGVAARGGPSPEVLRSIADEHVEECVNADRYDWRYYMVKYPAMREDGSSTYFSDASPTTGALAMGYSLCMLRAGRRARNSWHRDPYLLSIWRKLNDTRLISDPWFSGYEPRCMELERSGTTVRCVPRGFELGRPERTEDLDRLMTVCEEFQVGPDMILSIPQVRTADGLVDTIDRIEHGAVFVRRLLKQGL